MLAPLDEILQLLSLCLFLQVYVVLKSSGKADSDLKNGSYLFVKRMEQMGNDGCNRDTQVTVSTTVCVLGLRFQRSNYFNAPEQWDVIHWMLKKYFLILLSPHTLGIVVWSDTIVTCRSDDGI